MNTIQTILLPDLGEGVIEGEIIEWTKLEGDRVEKDETVVVVMTDKATVEMPSPYAGTLKKVYYQPGEVAIKDHPLYDIETADTPTDSIKPTQDTQNATTKADTAPQRPDPSPKPIISAEESIPAEKPHVTRPTGSIPTTKALASPATRKMARDLKIDINRVTGSGPGNRVTKADIARLAATSKPLRVGPEGANGPTQHPRTPVLSLPDDQRIPFRGLRRKIAERMVESKTVIPHFSYGDEADVSELVRLRYSLKERFLSQGVKLTFMPFLIKALSEALIKFPYINASLDLQQQEIVYHQPHHIGIAVDTPQGLIVPVIRHVEKMSILALAKALNDLGEKTKKGKVDIKDLGGSTVTISNFGAFGGTFATPIINYPEAAILGIAKIQKKPVIIDDQIVIRQMLYLSWSMDHRIIDGGQCAAFSNYYISIISNPAYLLTL